MKNLFYSAFFIIFISFSSCSSGDEVEDGLKTVHFSGTDKIKQTIEYKNGKKNGFFREYYPNGVLKAKQFYINDTLDDSTFIYSKNGKLKALQIYKDKMKSGGWKTFNDKGVLISEIFFKNGLLDSTCSEFSYRTNRLLKRIRYTEGTKNGLEETYYPSGEIQSKVYYEDGRVLIGTEEWEKNGKKINNDFKIYVVEDDNVLLKNTLTYSIRLENAKETDELFRLAGSRRGNLLDGLISIEKRDGNFLFKYEIQKGGFVMETVTIAAFRKTDFGNTFIKTQSFNVASNNF